ncbi:unnamed protein product [Phytophthora lilii]|uniref:Unnamed protein product n=1 Tax=Phytophthora lilii TaxID=2077276 RepID=A0A9W6XFB7_9STRA|nr:unnamed protein product [Phytophthora lilii]
MAQYTGITSVQSLFDVLEARLPSKVKLREASLGNDYASARLFMRQVDASIRYGLVIDPKTKKAIGQQGLLGKVEAYFGMVETQGRGTLHIHFLIWLVDGAQTLQKSMMCWPFRPSYWPIWQQSLSRADISDHVDLERMCRNALNEARRIVEQREIMESSLSSDHDVVKNADVGIAEWLDHLNSPQMKLFKSDDDPFQNDQLTWLVEVLSPSSSNARISQNAIDYMVSALVLLLNHHWRGHTNACFKQSCMTADASFCRGGWTTCCSLPDRGSCCYSSATCVTLHLGDIISQLLTVEEYYCRLVNGSNENGGHNFQAVSNLDDYIFRHDVLSNLNLLGQRYEEAVPVIQGYRLPFINGESSIEYQCNKAILSLVLFKPFRSLVDLIGNGSVCDVVWLHAYDHWESTRTDFVRMIMDNMSDYYRGVNHASEYHPEPVFSGPQEGDGRDANPTDDGNTDREDLYGTDGALDDDKCGGGGGGECSDTANEICKIWDTSEDLSTALESSSLHPSVCPSTGVPDRRINDILDTSSDTQVASCKFCTVLNFCFCSGLTTIEAIDKKYEEITICEQKRKQSRIESRLMYPEESDYFADMNHIAETDGWGTTYQTGVDTEGEYLSTLVEAYNECVEMTYPVIIYGGVESYKLHFHEQIKAKANIFIDKRTQRLFREQIFEELIATVMHPSRMMKQMQQFDDIEDFFESMGC